jgi:hypothetical protein
MRSCARMIVAETKANSAEVGVRAMRRDLLSRAVGFVGHPLRQAALERARRKISPAARSPWRVRFGTTRRLAPWPSWFDRETPGMVSPLLTRSGLVFIDVAMDAYFRAFDLETGKVLWARPASRRPPGQAGNLPRAPRRRPVRGDRGRRTWPARHEAGRLGLRLRASVTASTAPPGVLPAKRGRRRSTIRGMGARPPFIRASAPEAGGPAP